MIYYVSSKLVTFHNCGHFRKFCIDYISTNISTCKISNKYHIKYAEVNDQNTKTTSTFTIWNNLYFLFQVTSKYPGTANLKFWWKSIFANIYTNFCSFFSHNTHKLNKNVSTAKISRFTVPKFDISTKSLKGGWIWPIQVSVSIV